MKLQGSAISFPFRVDATGGFVCTDDQRDVIAQAIADVIETRKGERVMLPGYGLEDWVFAVQNWSFVPRLKYLLTRQMKAFVPLVKSVTIETAVAEDGRSIWNVRYTEVGSINAPGNMVFPVWRYRENVAA